MLPKPLQKKTKDFYYGKWIDGLYKRKYKKHYGLNDFFDTIALETTTYCNLRCSFCPNSNHERGLQKNEHSYKDPAIFGESVTYTSLRSSYCEFL